MNAGLMQHAYFCASDTMRPCLFCYSPHAAAQHHPWAVRGHNEGECNRLAQLTGHVSNRTCKCTQSSSCSCPSVRAVVHSMWVLHTIVTSATADTRAVHLCPCTTAGSSMGTLSMCLSHPPEASDQAQCQQQRVALTAPTVAWRPSSTSTSTNRAAEHQPRPSSSSSSKGSRAQHGLMEHRTATQQAHATRPA